MVALAAHATFLLISIIRLAIDDIFPLSNYLGQEMFMALFAFINQLCLSLIMPIVEILAFLIQARHISSVNFPNALSLSALVI